MGKDEGGGQLGMGRCRSNAFLAAERGICVRHVPHFIPQTAVLTGCCCVSKTK